MNAQKRHLTDLFFVLSLFGVFAVSSFTLILIGVQVYQASVSQFEDTYSTGTALSYTAEKLRQHDRENSVSLTRVGGETALVMKDTVNDETYLTYIYPYEDQLFELSVKEGIPVSPELGEKLLDVEDFSITEKDSGFLEFSASDSSGSRVRLLLHMRSDALSNQQ